MVAVGATGEVVNFGYRVECARIFKSASSFMHIQNRVWNKEKRGRTERSNIIAMQKQFAASANTKMKECSDISTHTHVKNRGKKIIVCYNMELVSFIFAKYAI